MTIVRSEALNDLTAEMLKAVGHPVRIKIMECLNGKELSVNDIVDRIGVEQSNVSRHLALLRHTGVLNHRRDGVSVYYSLRALPIMPLLQEMKRFVAAGEGKS